MAARRGIPPSGPPGLGGASPDVFDFYVESAADLPDPDGAGVRTLASGSYAWLDLVDGGDTELNIPAGATVSFVGFSPLYGFTTSRALDANAAVSVAANARLDARGMLLRNTSGDVDANVVRNNGGVFSAAATLVDTQGTGVRSAVGMSILRGCEISGPGLAGGLSCVSLGAGLLFASDCYLHDCDTLVRTVGPSALTLSLQGGFWANAIFGLNINGSVSNLVAAGQYGQNLQTAAVQYQSGAVARASIMNQSHDINVTRGIDWAAASIPSAGLACVGNVYGVAAPFVNFTETDARVNVKACVGSAGLLAETPIVP